MAQPARQALPFLPKEHHGRLIIMAMMVFAGQIEAGQRVIAPFRAMIKPIADMVRPSSKGWRIKYSGEKRTVTDGPFAETKELVAGYTLIQVKSREEALEWAKRFPNPAVDGKECEIEVRQLFELEDFGPSEAIERFRKIGVGMKK
jgi:hypothetical protein